MKITLLYMFLINFFNINFILSMGEENVKSEDKVQSLLMLCAIKLAKQNINDFHCLDIGFSKSIEVYIRKSMSSNYYLKKLDQRMFELMKYRELLKNNIGEHAYLVGIIDKYLKKVYRIEHCVLEPSDPYSYELVSYNEELTPLMAAKKNPVATQLILRMIGSHSEKANEKILSKIYEKFCLFYTMALSMFNNT